MPPVQRSEPFFLFVDDENRDEKTLALFKKARQLPHQTPDTRPPTGQGGVILHLSRATQTGKHCVGPGRFRAIFGERGNRLGLMNQQGQNSKHTRPLTTHALPSPHTPTRPHTGSEAL